MRANVKPLVHWAIYKGYTLRYQSRTPQCVTGVLTRPEGAVPFRYDPIARTLRIDRRPSATDADATPDTNLDPAAADRDALVIQINEYGWEIE
ncbi:MAG: hypothetical protein WDZ49_01420 [Litorilinea sp.]